MKENVSLKNLTTYKINGYTKYLFEPKNKIELLNKLKEIKDEKHMIIGNGSNLIFIKNYEGILIKLTHLNELNIDNNIITVQAGYNLIKLAYKLANEGYKGLEKLSGIPGTIGGAIYMNAGSYGSEIKDTLIDVTYINELNEIITKTKEELEFEYRSSIFKKNKNLIIIEARFKLEKSSKEILIKEIKEIKEKRSKSQPLDKPNAGSVFKNPENDYAGRLIEELGYKGKTIGNVKISEKHANFLLNINNATGEEIKNIIDLIKNDVKIKYNVDLKVEQEIIE